MTATTLRALGITLILAAAAPAQRAPEAPGARAARTAGEAGIPRHQARPGRARPLVAVVGYNPATEITDYVVPFAVLAESGVADVVALSTGPGPIHMNAGLRFQVQSTIEQFSARYPQGADYVIVPNVYGGEDDPELRAWLRRQAGLGATIVGICDGVPTVAKAGLLQGRRATGHWRTVPRLRRENPGTRWIRDRRYVADGNVITTTGVSASIPISMALVEAIGGRERALELGRRLGIADWSPRHDSDRFRLRGGSVVTALWNKARRHEVLGIGVSEGVDEIRVALMADAYSRTRRTSVVTVARTLDPIRTRRGLVLLPDRVAGDSRAPRRMLSLMENVEPVPALDRALGDIAERYGPATANFVALTMEYAWRR